MQFAEFLAEPVRRADDGPVGLALRPHGDRRHQGRRERHLRPAHAWAKTRRSPGWPPASSGSSCPTSSTTSRSSSRSPPSRKTGHAVEALGALGPDLREPPAVSQGGRLLAAAAEGVSQRRPRIAARAGSSGSTRSSATGAASSRRRRSRPAAGPRSSTASATAQQVEFTAHEIKVEKLLDDVKALLKSNPQQPRLAEDQHRRHRLSAGRSRTRSSTSAGRWPSGRWTLEPRENHFDKRVTVTTPLQKPGAYLVDGQDGRRQHQLHRRLGRRHGDRQEAARRQDLLLRGRRRHGQADRQGQRRVLRLAAESITTSRRGTKSSPGSSPSSPTPTARSSPIPKRQPQNYQWLITARTARRPLRLSRLHRRLVRPTGTTPSTTPRRSTRSPTGPSIGPTRR